MATKGAERWSTGISLPNGLSGAMQAVGGLFAMGADAIKFAFRRPFQAREFLEQSWFIARVALAPTFLVAIPFTVLISFILNILLRELGAADLSGAGAAFGAVTQVGPLVTVLIVAGAGATAMCADLGSRTIREEIDAMEVLGINPVQRLVTPRMLAAGLVALLLNSLVVIIGIVGGYVFSVFVQDVNPGAFAAGITLLTGVPEVIISCVKAALFGIIAGLVACYRGLTVIRRRPRRWATRSTRPWCTRSWRYSLSMWSLRRSASDSRRSDGGGDAVTLVRTLRATYPRAFRALGSWRRPVGTLASDW